MREWSSWYFKAKEWCCNLVESVEERKAETIKSPYKFTVKDEATSDGKIFATRL